MNRTCIATHGLPRLLHDIVRQVVSGQEDLDLIAETMEPELERLVYERRIKVAVLPSEGPVPSELGWRLLSRWSGLHVVELAADGSSAASYELRPHITRVTNVSLESLLRTIRAPELAPEVAHG